MNMKYNYVVYHIDGELTLVEVTVTHRIFTPFESVSTMNEYCIERDINVPIRNVITETATRSWREQLDELIACNQYV